MLEQELGIYIHIPFCKRKCYYCDFISYCNQDENIDRYIDALIKEIRNRKKKIVGRKVTTIYIGGGTPSFIKEQDIEKVLKTLEIKEHQEITIEVNPGTVNKQKLKTYRKIGINRISIGLQETHNNLLKQIGRIHTYEEFLETYKIARSVGFKNINVDLMIGLPNQSIQDIKENLERIILLNPEHISVYSLILEEGTPLIKKIDEEELKLPDEELERDMYWYVKNKLELNGYMHYEISNFAKAGYQSKHNMNCWKQKEYVGFGVAAHSYLNFIRFSNTSILNEYIHNIESNNVDANVKIQEEQILEDTQKEYMLLGLRKIDGVSISEFKNKFGKNPLFIYKEELNELVETGFLRVDLDAIKLTNKGIDFANLVWEKFV
ncbi:MAG: oxygen-independent coproporphyrinogen III oxidase [Clostridia bacterium]|nr:oxygen-independent coproporphyrinogen III oxidase [Clostridia bacterium]